MFKSQSLIHGATVSSVTPVSVWHDLLKKRQIMFQLNPNVIQPFQVWTAKQTIYIQQRHSKLAQTVQCHTVHQDRRLYQEIQVRTCWMIHLSMEFSGDIFEPFFEMMTKLSVLPTVTQFSLSLVKILGILQWVFKLSFSSVLLSLVLTFSCTVIFVTANSNPLPFCTLLHRPSPGVHTVLQGSLTNQQWGLEITLTEKDKEN